MKRTIDQSIAIQKDLSDDSTRIGIGSVTFVSNHPSGGHGGHVYIADPASSNIKDGFYFLRFQGSMFILKIELMGGNGECSDSERPFKVIL